MSAVVAAADGTVVVSVGTVLSQLLATVAVPSVVGTLALLAVGKCTVAAAAAAEAYLDIVLLVVDVADLRAGDREQKKGSEQETLDDLRQRVRNAAVVTELVALCSFALLQLAALTAKARV